MGTLTQADQIAEKANEGVSSALKYIAMKKQQATGILLAEITKLEERAKAAEKRLIQLKSSHKEASEPVSCEVLMKEASEKLQTVYESVMKAADAEGPFLMGMEELPLEETLEAVKACETAAISANTAVSTARMFIATKLVDAKRFSPGPIQEAQTKLKDLQKQLDTHTKRLNDLKTATSNRKRTSLMREAENMVRQAEGLTREVSKVATVFEDDAKLSELSSDTIRSTADQTAKSEAAANAAIAEARKFITARQIEAKGRDASSEVSAELIKFQTRLSTSQGELAKFKKLASTVESRLARMKAVEECSGKLTAAEEKVDKVAKRSFDSVQLCETAHARSKQQRLQSGAVNFPAS